jgi:hypothetical protein
LWVEQPSDRGGRLLTCIDFSGRSARELAGVVPHGTSWRVLHATSSTPDRPEVARVHAEGTSLIVEAQGEASGIVLHLTGDRDAD